MLTITYWEDESTVCYHQEVTGIVISRRRDNDMINGTKLLNITGMSRGRRENILRDVENSVRVRVGAMHLKGTWIPYHRAVELAVEYGIDDILHPLLADNPSEFVSVAATAQQNNIPAPSHL
ncbi:hypothetical protein LRAMOSA07037 [Lichtheimia ramosa]|uniref:HTH APSES-type domain-containing protein n=1 Tax=Lichtheimia ramosa TaxID=688394 RepID=A0A077W9T9_9FUNG|nr:hypothetical protein LRAMOSA07037 [Lichtheimia ramosa]